MANGMGEYVKTKLNEALATQGKSPIEGADNEELWKAIFNAVEEYIKLYGSAGGDPITFADP